MKIIQEHIVRHQERFSDHPFFVRLSTDPPLERLAPFPVCLTFFVMTFQDILRICDERATDPEYKRMVHRHRLEDAGHDRWFLGDLAALGVAPPTAAELFGEPHHASRDASLALLSDALGARHDTCRLTLLLTLESAGHVFFERVARYLVRVGERRRLRYFSQAHLDIEKAHDIFEEDTDARIEAIVLDQEERAEALRVSDRCYRELTGMFDAFEAQIAAGAARPQARPSMPQPARGAALRFARTPVLRPSARRRGGAR
ncbi:hypothetical protein BE21_04445 [Sorangium cellulosum]|uniref:Uncharacterized protein n=1 Tax=Sorangium cellulosum TaxID=56 RepID=A0A150TGC7_SORCE|nr:hypothetical protein BE21_04445 [Sorangium cellulosum]